MKVEVLNPIDWLTGEAGCVVVVDLARCLVQQIIAVQPHHQTIAELVAQARRHGRTGPRAPAVVLDEWARSEVAHIYASEPIVEIIERQSGGNDSFNGTRNVSARSVGVLLAEASMGSNAATSIRTDG